jgi:hypothetical protein
LLTITALCIDPPCNDCSKVLRYLLIPLQCLLTSTALCIDPHSNQLAHFVLMQTAPTTGEAATVHGQSFALQSANNNSELLLEPLYMALWNVDGQALVTELLPTQVAAVHLGLGCVEPGSTRVGHTHAPTTGL